MGMQPRVPSDSHESAEHLTHNGHDVVDQWDVDLWWMIAFTDCQSGGRVLMCRTLWHVSAAAHTMQRGTRHVQCGRHGQCNTPASRRAGESQSADEVLPAKGKVYDICLVSNCVMSCHVYTIMDYTCLICP